MKMITLALILTLFSLTLKAPSERAIVIVKTEAIEPYETIWDAVVKVESNGDLFAIGDRHLKDKSYGIVQIRQVRLDDYFERTEIRYSEKDMFDPVKSKEIFLYYADRIGPYDMERIIRNWNGKWELTDDYYAKVRKVLKRNILIRS